jgi:lysozyme family protein
MQPTTTNSRFLRAMARIFQWEGGLVDNPKDPGGITNLGISLRWLEGQGIDINGDGKVDAKDVKALTPETAEQLYLAHFWRAAYGQIKSEDVAIYVFDMAVNMGAERAHRIAQEACGAEADGQIGPKTLSALNAVEPSTLLRKMREIRAKFYNDLAARKPALAVFLKGWLKRAAA